MHWAGARKRLPSPPLILCTGLRANSWQEGGVFRRVLGSTGEDALREVAALGEGSGAEPNGALLQTCAMPFQVR